MDSHKNLPTYGTTDIALAATLYCVGYGVHHLRGAFLPQNDKWKDAEQGRRLASFCFIDTPELRTAIQHYDDDILRVEPKKLMSVFFMLNKRAKRYLTDRTDDGKLEAEK